MTEHNRTNSYNDKNSDIEENFDIDTELNTFSAYDCTGLIPSAITDESEIEAYEEIYPYLSPTAGIDDQKDNI